MKKAENIVGYVVLDEGRPVRNTGEGSDPLYRYWSNSRAYPVAIFPSRKVARRVKQLLFRKFADIANGFNPEIDEQQRRCFNLWASRSKGLRIAAVRMESPTVEDFRVNRRCSHDS